MGFAELGRIALEVDDVDAVAADLHDVLGMEMEIHSQAEATLGLKAAVGSDGVELVQRGVPNPDLAKYWRPPLVALILGVDDLEEAARRMKGGGFELVQTVVTPSGFRELFYGDHFHGFPLVLFQKDESDLLHAPGDGEMVVDESPTGPPRARPRPAAA